MGVLKNRYVVKAVSITTKVTTFVIFNGTRLEFTLDRMKATQFMAGVIATGWCLKAQAFDKTKSFSVVTL
jgi:hypothetical protein